MELFKVLTVAMVLPVVFMTSCQPNNQREGNETEESIIVNTVMEKEPIQPRNGLLLFDISHSTKGYLEGSAPEFRGVTSQMGRMLKVKNYYLYGESPKEVPSDRFFDTLNSGKFTWAQESDLIGMIEFMVQAIKESNDIACLISDGIMSGTNKQISGTEYNIQSREVMRNRLESVLEGLDDGQSALVVRYLAPFNGPYFCYNNASYQLKCQRPYFAIIVGSWEKIKWLEQDLIVGKEQGKTDSFYKFSDLVMFGDENTYNKLRFGVRSGIEKRGDSYTITCKDSIAFSCDIKNLPPYMRTESYVKENLRILKKRENQQDYTVIPEEKYSLIVDENRNKIVIWFINNGVSNVVDSYISKNDICISLKYSIPNWIKEFSDDNDKVIHTNPIKQIQTFNLRYFIESFRVINHVEYVVQTDMRFL